MVNVLGILKSVSNSFVNVNFTLFTTQQEISDVKLASRKGIISSAHIKSSLTAELPMR